MPRVRDKLPLWAKIALALHFPVIVIGVNYFAPGSPFQASKTVPQQLEAISHGLAVSPRASERVLRKELVLERRSSFDVMAYGSSRALAIDSDTVGTTNFLNAGASYGTLFDFAALYSLLERTDRFPKKMVVSLDGWMLNAEVRTTHWLEYGNDVPRGLQLVGMQDRFGLSDHRLNSLVQGVWRDFTYVTSPATFAGNLADIRQRLRTAGSLSALRPQLITRPIDLEKDGWAADLAYWYPCVKPETVRDRAVNWGTDRAEPGQRLLEGTFSEIDRNLLDLLRRLLMKLKEHRVSLYIFLSPLHPISYSDMTLTPVRRNTAKAEEAFRNLGRELGIPVFGAHDPSAVGLTAADFCTDAIHIRPDVMRRVFERTGLRSALTQ